MVHRADEKILVSYVFGGSVSASSRATFVSKRIGFPFRTKQFQFWADLGTDESVDLYCFCGADDGSPTVEFFDELNLLAQRGNRSFVRAENQWISFEQEIVIDMIGTFLKVHVNNQSALTQNIQAVLTIAWLKTEQVSNGI